MEEEKVKQRWKVYFDNLLNQENPRERRETRTEERERDVEDISGEEVRTGLRRMKKGKAQGPDDIPVEAWIALGNKGVEFLVKFFNRLLRGKKMPDEWRRSVLVPLYKGKGDIMVMKISVSAHTLLLLRAHSGLLPPQFFHSLVSFPLSHLGPARMFPFLHVCTPPVGHMH